MSKEIIEQYGTRLSPHSKFYIYEDKLFEPCYYRNKFTKTYKPITDVNKITRIIDRQQREEIIPTISSVCSFDIPKKHNQSKTTRFELLDL